MSKQFPVDETRKAVKDLKRAAIAEDGFVPGPLQKRVKARFYRRLEEQSHMFDQETAFSTPQIMEDLAGTSRIFGWLEDPVFASWFLDEEFVGDTIMSLQSDAVNVIQEALLSEDATMTDRLKAARMLLELGDQFPGRKSEVRFLDDRLNQLSESEVEKETKKLEAALGESDKDE